MTQRRKFSAEYKREAVAMLEVPGVTVHQVATELGIGAGVLGRWGRELRQAPPPGRFRAKVDRVKRRSFSSNENWPG